MYKRGDSWYSDFWYKGERYIESRGPVSKSVANEKDRKMRTAVAEGKYVKLDKDPPFDKAIENHLKKSKVENKPNSYIANTYRAKHLKAYFGKKRIGAIEGNGVLMRGYLNKRKIEIKTQQMEYGRKETEVTYTTINRELALLRKMFNDLIKSNKAKKILFPL